MKVDLSAELSKMIDEKKQDLLRVINSELVVLFWQIGKYLNRYISDNKNTESPKNTFHTALAQLPLHYGRWFSEKNLTRMRLFAAQISDYQNVAKIAPFISWGHITFLLRFRDVGTQLYYFQIIVEKGLSINELRKHVSQNNFGSNKGEVSIFKRKIDYADKFKKIFQIALKQTTTGNLSMGNVFKMPLSNFFRPLVEPKKKKITKYRDEFFVKLEKHIEVYRYRQNKWLNSSLNQFFGEVGRRINHEMLVNKRRIDSQVVIHNLSLLLKKRNKKGFSEKRLIEMNDFASQFSDPNLVSWLSYVLTWEHILVLLPIEDICSKFFYARLAALHKLTPVDLERRIDEKIYEKSSENKYSVQRIILEIQKSTSRKKITKKKNNTTIENTVFIDLGDLRANQLEMNIFKNPYLSLIL